MPLSDDQHERLELILDGLEAVRAKLSERSRTFVDDQIARHAKYGQQMFLSPKQEKWLTDLYEEHVGTKPEAVGTSYAPQDAARRAARDDQDDERDPRGDDDMDIIPF